MSRKTYNGEGIDVTFDLRRCIHVAECGKRLQVVFDVKKRPWAQPDNASVDEVARTIEHCPSGALGYIRKDGGSQEQPSQINTIVIKGSGEYRIHGDVQVTKMDGEVIEEDYRMTLCRCGDSANKPFCDNTHKKARFVAESTVHDNSAETAAFEAGGLLNIVMAPGPLLVNGKFEIQDESGNQVFRGDKTALCRCGDSANKPFCDGTHKNNGFYERNGL
ncbi:MAG: CDGSH iron-sulfur domain-containing protein [Chloroflexota bacterium]